MRQKIVAGNWKMHKNAEQTEDLLNELIAQIPTETTAQVIVAPTFVNLASAVDHLEFTNIAVAAYYCYIESWTMAYVYHSVIGTFQGMTQGEVAQFFGNFPIDP